MEYSCLLKLILSYIVFVLFFSVGSWIRPEDNVLSELVLLSGAHSTAVSPYVIHVSIIAEGVSLVLLYQVYP